MVCEKMYDPVKPTVRPDMTVMVRFPNADIGQKGTERKFMVRFEISLDCGTRFWTVATFVRVLRVVEKNGGLFPIEQSVKRILILIITIMLVLNSH